MARRMPHRYSNQMEQGFKGSKGVPGKTSGSHAHVGETHGPGELPGAGQIGFLGAPSTGKSREASAAMPSDAFPSRATPAAPKLRGTPSGE